MEVIDRGLHPAVYGQSLGERVKVGEKGKGRGGGGIPLRWMECMWSFWSIVMLS